MTILEISVASTDSDDFHFILQIPTLFNSLIQFVHPERFFLTKGSVHVEDFNDDHLCLDIRDSKIFSHR